MTLRTVKTNIAGSVLLSLLFCLISFFIVRVGDSFLLSYLLKINQINHDYHLMFIEYRNGKADSWSEGILLMVYTIPYVLWLILGLYLPHFLRNSHNNIVKLLVTWFSFHSVLLFIGTLITGLFEYKALGITMDWFFEYKSLKVTSVILIFILLTWSLRRFAWYFLRCEPGCYDCFEAEILKKTFIFLVILPFVASFFLVLTLSPEEVILNHFISMVAGSVVMLLIYNISASVYLPSENHPHDASNR